ncbi:hypothetical protein G7070_02625 [Propioniciclava coleopterorum]|uniref:Oligosaccharide repeat unit polymerase n=1 Tax=Propioniciclava coleopterorum TaxID=2714937 RepID=A0A6G7Y3J7_9ACTN|nr:hypothetical protein [Propioniciclava coleopterorum]QIK71382.1 hypothetical protein G7070_02625 [Propioniciclava coleopterorum]
MLGLAALAVSGAARAYFTVPVLPGGSFGVDLKATSALDEAAIMVAVTGKHLAFLAALIWAWRRFEASGARRYVWAAVAATVANGVLLYGTNRLAALFVAASSILAYLALFPRHRARLTAPAVAGLVVVYAFMTRARNYWDPYAAYSGPEHALRNAESLINHYLGGIHNVAISVRMAETYGAHAGLTTLLYDLVRPVPVLNLLARGDGAARTSNQYFNLEFYQSTKMDVILPAVGQGGFYVGPWLAWTVPVALLLVGVAVERWMLATRRVEHLYLGSLVLMRLGTLMGSNATIQANEMAIQFLLPIAMVWLLGEVRVRGDPSGSAGPKRG